MDENLQGLLERIQKEGVQKADAEAERIVAEARQKAAEVAARAKSEADALRAQAEADSRVFAERGRKALDQAARDVILSVGEAIQDSFQALVSRKVDEALDDAVLKQMLVKFVEGYCAKGGDGGDVDVLLNPDQQKALTGFFVAEYQEALRRGLEIHADRQVVKGFKVSVGSGHLSHDFSRDAIVEALCQFLRPKIADIVRGAASSVPAGTKKP
jgi:V/A-type H+-transporting ATPase subunit E